MKKRIAILGSTGSIGQQALEVIENHSDLFEVEVITANNNAELLISQALKFKPSTVVIANENKYNEVSTALTKSQIKVFAGEKAISQVVEYDSIDIVLTAMVGYSGLLPTINAISWGKNIALANKETLVIAGDLIMQLAKKKQVDIIPVDSEHSAIFQCLTGEMHNQIEKIILTASGGPFRQLDFESLKKVTKNDALKHPNWNMGNKITIDSATLMNKGFEAIEAKWLFDVRPEQIEIIVHPQSIIHSLVQFSDSSIKAQLGLPDMKLPIQYALSYPKRIKSNFPRFNFSNFPNFSFEEVDNKKFRNLVLAFEAMKTGGNMPCIINAANEIVVNSFLNEKIGFLSMSEIIESTMGKVSFIKNPSYDDYVETNIEARQIANDLCKQYFL
ncbi:MAG: 1-deoxy-D-xylulose-5-phosphate reductoisomerase [Bacteroidetes bacterium]|jgi:1-deoxy-D-xylulose-5-phosphate reductoisomerase|nr:1-deoxy-D-xylulose-5-phosphate reductoisomerase [Bacteroidota bacterium]MBT6685378.1 1-deoxy-D-xylulose-5-phosphate reductoisomerase [Bacteroidota bacterium]MBT7145042.1 1-deoxy-D-xylulose-5-phosphate reductoisomerase [Bacteroidota bacterium]MBT7492727.1 1-deoxy-D-xylulose-5-phosphate reductoisomerase [Bacteroidota bacterium]